MGATANANLCNELVNTIRSISTRVNADNLDLQIKEEIRPIFISIRPKYGTVYNALRNDKYEADVDEWKFIKTVRENIEASLDTELSTNLNSFEETLDEIISLEELDVMTEDPFGNDDILEESKLDELLVPAT